MSLVLLFRHRRTPYALSIGSDKSPLFPIDVVREQAWLLTPPEKKLEFGYVKEPPKPQPLRVTVKRKLSQEERLAIVNDLINQQHISVPVTPVPEFQQVVPSFGPNIGDAYTFGVAPELNVDEDLGVIELLQNIMDGDVFELSAVPEPVLNVADVASSFSDISTVLELEDKSKIFSI